MPFASPTGAEFARQLVAGSREWPVHGISASEVYPQDIKRGTFQFQLTYRTGHSSITRYGCR
jgi:hypothetical protein